MQPKILRNGSSGNLQEIGVVGGGDGVGGDDACAMFIDKGSEPTKMDCKNSRRKAEKPRKRRRDNDNGEEPYIDDDFLNNRKDLDCSKMPHLMDEKNPANEMTHIKTSKDFGHMGVPIRGQSDKQLSNTMSSPIPEDLSTKSNTGVVHSPIQSSHLTQTPAGRDCSSDWPGPMDNNHDYSRVGQHTSVKDLEDVMNRHLPTITENPDSNMGGDLNSRYTARHKPTIQWIGSHQNSTDSLPATTLLRSIFANRESVIRSNICNNRPQCYNEIPVSMLTPPSGDGGYKDHSNVSLTPMSSGVKTPVNQEPQYVPTTSYSTTPLTVSMSCNNISDSYNITPPSSVSPQDKLNSPFADSNYVDSTTHCGNMTNDGSAIQRIPIKPQAGYTLTVTSPTLEYDHTKSSGYSNPNTGPYIPTSSEYAHFNHVGSGSAAPSAYDHNSHRSGSWYSTSYTT